MKSKTWMFLLSVLLLLCAGLSLPLLLPGETAAQAEIWSDGVLLRTVDLRIDQSFEVENQWGSNTVTVSGGKIAVTRASCPDHYCMHRGYCNSGAQIVCLPNRFVIKFIGKTDVDSAAG